MGMMMTPDSPLKSRTAIRGSAPGPIAAAGRQAPEPLRRPAAVAPGRLPHAPRPPRCRLLPRLVVKPMGS